MSAVAGPLILEHEKSHPWLCGPRVASGFFDVVPGKYRTIGPAANGCFACGFCGPCITQPKSALPAHVSGYREGSRRAYHTADCSIDRGRHGNFTMLGAVGCQWPLVFPMKARLRAGVLPCDIQSHEPKTAGQSVLAALEKISPESTPPHADGRERRGGFWSLRR